MSDTEATTASPEARDAERNTRKVRQGVVVRAGQDKTIVVAIQRRTTHALYGKTVERTNRFHVHDEHNDAGVGDTVRIIETRPLSKKKRWRLDEIIERAK